MAKISVYYDYHDSVLSPMWMVINFGKGSIDWTKDRVFLHIHTPFTRKRAEDFDENVLSMSITFDDLLVNQDKEGYFGIYLPRVLQRLNKSKGESIPYSIDDIEQFIIQMSDLEELLSMDRNQLFKHART